MSRRPPRCLAAFALALGVFASAGARAQLIDIDPNVDQEQREALSRAAAEAEARAARRGRAPSMLRPSLAPPPPGRRSVTAPATVQGRPTRGPAGQSPPTGTGARLQPMTPGAPLVLPDGTVRPTWTPTGRPPRAPGEVPGLEPPRPSVSPPFRSLGTPGSVARDAAPPPVAERRAEEADPYGPAGLRVGSFELRPAFTVAAGFDSNPRRLPGQPSSPFWLLSPEVSLRSDWARHAISADLRGSYLAYTNAPGIDQPTADLRVGGRFDVTAQTSLSADAVYRLTTDAPGSLNVPGGASRLPQIATTGAILTAAHRFNRLGFVLRGTIEHTDVQDTPLATGGVISNADRAFALYSTRLRAFYELSPGFQPFVEAGIERRDYDLAFDRFGIRRGSDGFTTRFGSTFELGRLVTGEVALGLLRRDFADASLASVTTPTIDAAIAWAVSPLTTLRLVATTEFAEILAQGTAGLVTYEGAVEVEHAFRRWLVATARAGYARSDYVDSPRIDERFVAQAGLTWSLSRSVAIRGSFRQEWLRSNIPGRDYTASIATVGLRFQR